MGSRKDENGQSPKLRIPHSLWGVSTDTSLARDIRIGEAQSPVGAALIDQAKRDQGFDSPLLHVSHLIRTAQMYIMSGLLVLVTKIHTGQT